MKRLRTLVHIASKKACFAVVTVDALRLGTLTFVWAVRPEWHSVKPNAQLINELHASRRHQVDAGWLGSAFDGVG